MVDLLVKVAMLEVEYVPLNVPLQGKRHPQGLGLQRVRTGLLGGKGWAWRGRVSKNSWAVRHDGLLKFVPKRSSRRFSLGNQHHRRYKYRANRPALSANC